MANLYVMCGISGSGKFTYAEKLNKELEKSFIVSTDNIREMLWGNASIQSHSDLVFDIAYVMIEEGLNSDFDVIFDATNLHKSHRINLINKFKHLAELHCIYFEINIDDAIKRNGQRARKVPVKVIQRQYDTMSVPEISEGWHSINYL